MGIFIFGLDERVEESKHIISKYPDRVPVSFQFSAIFSCIFLWFFVFVGKMWIRNAKIVGNNALVIWNFEICSCWCYWLTRFLNLFTRFCFVKLLIYYFITIWLWPDWEMITFWWLKDFDGWMLRNGKLLVCLLKKRTDFNSCGLRMWRMSVIFFSTVVDVLCWFDRFQAVFFQNF